MASQKSWGSRLWSFNLFLVKFVGGLTLGLWIAFFFNYNQTKLEDPDAGLLEGVGDWYGDTVNALPGALAGACAFLSDLFTDAILPGASTLTAIFETAVESGVEMPTPQPDL